MNVLTAYSFTAAQERIPLLDNILQTYVIPRHQFSLVATQRIGRRLAVVFDLLASSNYLFPLFDGVTFANHAFRFPGQRYAELGGSYRVPVSDSMAVRFFAKASNIFNQSYYESGYRTPGAGGTGGIEFQF